MRYLFLCLFVGLSLCSCAVTGTPVGQTEVRLKGYPASLLQQKVEEAFARDSFILVQSMPDRLVFERSGGRTEEVVYGDWMGRNTAVRVTVHFIQKGTQDYVMRTDSRIIRNPNSAFEDRSDLFDMQALKYKRYLNEVKRELKTEYPNGY